MNTMHQTIDSLLIELRKQPGIDLPRLRSGNRIIVETGDAVYQLTLEDQANGIVRITSTDRRIGPDVRVQFVCSTYDQEGRVAINGWIGKGLRMQFRFSNGLLQSTPAISACVFGVNETGEEWQYDIF